MPTVKQLVRSVTILAIGALVGSAITYLIQQQRSKRSDLETQAFYQELATKLVIDQLSLLKNKDLITAECKLYHELAWHVYIAKSLAHEKGLAGQAFSRILEISTEQRKNPLYLIEEAKVQKRASEPKYIL